VDGVLFESEGAETVAYVGIEVDSQTDALDWAQMTQAGWLSSLTPRWGLATEVRYLVDPPGPPRLVLLARVTAGESVALAAATEAVGQLGAAPGVTSHRLQDAAQIAAVLRPFRPHPGGMVEIRKQVQVAEPLRPDAGVRFYATVPPFTCMPSGRATLALELVRAGIPLAVAVGVQPLPRPSWLAAFLAENAAAYSRLAQPAMWRPPGSVHQPLRHLPADPFAVTAAAHYQREVERLGGWVGRLRVQVSAPAPISDALAHCIGAAFGSDRVVRPPTAEARAAYDRAFATLQHVGWPDETHALGEQFRVLAVAADAGEAAAALGLSAWDLARSGRDDCERALDVLLAVGRAMERAAPTYAGAGEETLRDHLVTALNGAFAGSVYAEARNGAGRTDILIRIADRTVLVVECKVWNGSKRLHDAVDQLLGYLTRRDEASALVTFLRGGVPDAMTRADAVIRTHPALVRIGGADGNDRRDYVLRRTDGGEVPFTFVPIG
jgi:hypothetical protein